MSEYIKRANLYLKPVEEGLITQNQALNRQLAGNALANLAVAESAHTANLIAHRSYLLEQAFDRKLSDREQGAVELLNTQIAERLGLNV